MSASERSNAFFSETGYRKIIRTALEAGYQLGPFCQALSMSSPALILRHDIDLSLELAVRLAEVEADMGVASTYFIMVTNDYYSPFNRVGRAQVNKIRSLGHEIGLHWDSSNYPQDTERVKQQFANELALLGDVIGEKITSAAQHIPTDSPIFDVESYVEVEAYAQVYRDRFRYISDSSMKWRQDTPLELIKSGVDIHFCSHPVWWMATGADQGEKLRASCAIRVEEMNKTNEEFISYIEEFLANREAFDKAFIAKKGAMNE